MEKPWLEQYPKGVDTKINPDSIKCINTIFKDAVKNFSNKNAFENFGTSITYKELDEESSHFASFLQHKLGLKKGDRIAIQLPNLLQYPIALFGAFKAGLVVVNTNPLYTESEMLHQFKDSEIEAVVILSNFAHKLEGILDQTSIKHIVVTGVGDLLGFPKSTLINFVLKHVKKQVPDYHLPNAYSFHEAIRIGTEKKHKPISIDIEDTAFLQYTGGTTGISKGAELTHKNIVANMLQICEWMKPKFVKGQEAILTPLPLYHIFSLTVNCFGLSYFGGTNILITNPKDIPAFIKLMKKRRFTVMTGVNTLFNALLNHPDFKKLDFSKLKLSVAGGMALQESVSKRWLDITKTPVIEGYGLTETSPVASCNPVNGTDRVGTIGLPLPSTEMKLIDEEGNLITGEEAGELCIKGPQVMKSYWKRPDETKKVLTPDGWLKTGDIAIHAGKGYFKIVDRKKDMILVSGFNVYPNEVEEVVSQHPGVLEVAAIGVHSEKSGEAVKICVVKKDDALTADQLIAFCKGKLTGYKTPDVVEFYDELPKSNVGKILRRELKEKTNK